MKYEFVYAICIALFTLSEKSIIIFHNYLIFIFHNQDGIVNSGDNDLKNPTTEEFMAILERNSNVLQQATEKNKEISSQVIEAIEAVEEEEQIINDHEDKSENVTENNETEKNESEKENDKEKSKQHFDHFVSNVILKVTFK